ncbi:MAG: helix-turn-helix domain-containing protein [Candidatus Bipolaricaulia bacterium]
MDLEELGRRLRSVRNSRGLTLDELSSRLDVSPSYLSEVERGNKIPSLKVLCNLSSYLGVPKNVLREALEGSETELESFGEMLANRRDDLGLTKKDLSRVMGWPVTCLEAVESGSSTVPEEFLEDLAEALELPRDFFEYAASETIGGKLKFFRQIKDFTQSELSEESGVSPSLVSKIERGEVQPSLPTLAKISEALGISPCCFVFQLQNQGSSREEEFERQSGDKPPSKKSRLDEIIAALSGLTEEELDELQDYLAELRR